MVQLVTNLEDLLLVAVGILLLLRAASSRPPVSGSWGDSPPLLPCSLALRSRPPAPATSSSSADVWGAAKIYLAFFLNFVIDIFITIFYSFCHYHYYFYYYYYYCYYYYIIIIILIIAIIIIIVIRQNYHNQ